MTIKKRLRVLWAAVTQDWHHEHCDDCKAAWWSDRRCVPSSGLCMDCEDRQFAEWEAKRKSYIFNQTGAA